MQIYILRHGIAEDSHSGGDAKRRLTDEGKEKLHDVLKAAKRGDVAPDVIVSSPYVRAMQTAEIAASVLGYKDDLVQADALVPDSEPASVWQEVKVHRDAGQLMLVGHEPLLSRVVAHLLGCPELQVDMKKAAIVRVDIDNFGRQPQGVLRWMLVPKLA